MIDLRKQVVKRMKALDWSVYRLSKELGGKVPASTLYGFMGGSHPINSDHLSLILTVLGVEIGWTERKVTVKHGRR